MWTLRQVAFSIFKIGKICDCHKIFQVSSFYESDYVRIFDEDLYGREYLVAQLTGSNVPLDISSLGQKMLIVFDSGWQFASAYKGFKANIIMEETDTVNKTNACSVTNPCQIDEGHCQFDGQCLGTLRCGENNCPQHLGNGTNCCYNYCEQFLDMENKILDYYMPHGFYYGDLKECSWSIQVANDQVITMEFIEDFKVSSKSNYEKRISISWCHSRLTTSTVMILLESLMETLLERLIS